LRGGVVPCGITLRSVEVVGHGKIHSGGLNGDVGYPSMETGPLFERSVPSQAARVLGLTVLLFLFSVLDPLPLIIMDVSSLLVFLSSSVALRGLGLLGFGLYSVVFFQMGAWSPASMLVLVSSLSFGYLLRMDRFRGVMFPAVASGLIALVSVWTFSTVSGGDRLSGWVEGYETEMRGAIDRSLVQLEEAGVVEMDELVKVKESMEELVGVMVRLLPAIVFIDLLLAATLGTIIFGLVSRENRLTPRVRELKYFSFPDILVWALIVGLIFLLLPLPRSVLSVLLNVLVVIVIFYILRGMGVGIYWLQRRGLSPLLIVLVAFLVFILLPPIFFISLFLPGLLDTWYDFRSMEKEA